MDSMEIDDDIYINKSLTTAGLVTQVDFQRRKQPSRCASVCLGLLCAVLLAGNIGQIIYYNIITHCSSEDPTQANYNTLTQEKEYLQNNNDNLTTEKDQLQRNFDSLTVERKELENRLSNLTKDKDQLKAGFNNLKNTKHNNLTASKDQLQTKYSNLQREKDELQSRFSTAMINLTDYSSLKRDKDQLQRRYNTLSTSKDQLQTSYNSLLRDKDQLQTRYNSLWREWLQTNNSILATRRDQLQKKVDKLAVKLRARPCQTGWRKFDISCYFMSTMKKNWTESRKACIANAADLVVIDSRDEQAYVNGLLDVSQNAWIGLTDHIKEGTWMWVDGTPVTTQYWQPGQPNSFNGNQDCGEIVQQSSGKVGEWNDDGCFSEQLWICEK
ncbi:C-type lectin domain family 4 member M-like isoform X1 [Lates japonicus]